MIFFEGLVSVCLVKKRDIMNLITLLLIVDRFITPMHLRKPGFVYSVSEPFTKMI